MHPHGLVSLTEEVNKALSTLAASDALDLDLALGQLTTTFLIKRVRFFLKAVGVTAEEGPLLIGMASGNTSIAEIELGMQITNTVGPQDTTQTLSQDEAWKIYRNTIEMLRPEAVETTLYSSGKWINFPGRGIPALGAQGSGAGGFRSWVFNAGTAALTTGAVVKGIIEYQGVWLRD